MSQIIIHRRLFFRLRNTKNSQKSRKFPLYGVFGAAEASVHLLTASRLTPSTFLISLSQTHATVSFSRRNVLSLPSPIPWRSPSSAADDVSRQVVGRFNALPFPRFFIASPPFFSRTEAHERRTRDAQDSHPRPRMPCTIATFAKPPKAHSSSEQRRAHTASATRTATLMA